MSSGTEDRHCKAINTCLWEFSLWVHACRSILACTTCLGSWARKSPPLACAVSLIAVLPMIPQTLVNTCVCMSDKDQQPLSGIKPPLLLSDHTDHLQNSANSQDGFLVSQPSWALWRKNKTQNETRPLARLPCSKLSSAMAGFAQLQSSSKCASGHSRDRLGFSGKMTAHLKSTSKRNWFKDTAQSKRLMVWMARPMNAGGWTRFSMLFTVPVTQ